MNKRQILRAAYFMLGVHRFFDQILMDQGCKPTEIAADFINMLRNGLKRQSD